LRGLTTTAIALALAGCGGGAARTPHHPSGPPVTAQQLRRQIERSGLEIEWHDGKAGGNVIADLAGEARDRRTGGRISFELAVARSRRANTSMLGRSRYGSPNAFTDDVSGVPRGVIRNLAYANWVASDDDSEAADRVSARLDQAILAAFPPTDAEAHPILSSPPE
jgi:hypothetical protein